MQYFIYLLRCTDDTLYCGYTTDVTERVKTHNGETNKIGAKYTRGRRPVELVYQESYATKSEALKREIEIKRLSRAQKETLLVTAQ